MKTGRPRAAVYTLGCKVNQYESQAIAEALAEAGFEILDFHEKCDIYIINTCTVTAESDRKARQIVRRAWHQNTEAGIFVTGCYAQTQPEAVAKLPGVVYVCGSRNKLSVVTEALKYIDSVRPLKEDICICVSDVERDPFEKMSIRRAERVRAGIKIEDGCDNRCTYCAIPGARGRVASKPPQDVLAEAESLVRAGYCEIVLTGIETASYGKDLTGVGLIDLLELVDRIPCLERVRLGSLDPSYLSMDVISRMSELIHLAPHFHLSVQSGSDAVLCKMKRRYRAETVARSVAEIRKYMPQVLFTADIIVGFPGETDAQFQETVSLVEQIGFLHVHVFPFSPRTGTVAAKMQEQVSEHVKRQRVAVLNDVQQRSEKRICRLEAEASRTYSVLFERHENGRNIGRAANFLEISVPGGEDLSGKIRTVRVMGIRAGMLHGVLI